MAGHDIIVVGASAGGIQAIQELVRGLPRDLPAAMFIVVHTSPQSGGLLPQIVDRASVLAAERAANNRPFERGRIYIAEPDHHLLIKRGRMCVVRGPRENGFRPAVDPLFRTAARAYGPRVVGIILSGGLDDGTAGLTEVKRAGGIAIVQDPQDASFPSMPESAIRNVEVDHVLKVAEMSELLASLAHEPAPEGMARMGRDNGDEPDIAELGTDALNRIELDYPPSAFTCPECGGALWELKGGKPLRYRCHVGHGYTVETLLAEQTSGLETALWIALRALEESAGLRRRMAARAREGRCPALERRYAEQAAESEARAGVIRKVLVSEPGDARRMPQSRPKRGKHRSISGKTAKPNNHRSKKDV